MALTPAQELVGYGFSYPLATELIAQIDAADGDGVRLMALGMSQSAAVAIETALDSGGIPPLGTVNRLVAAGIPPLAAQIIVDAFAGVVLTLSGTPVLTATENVAYAGFTVSAAGGATPYVYSLVGTWPTGLSINSSTGEVSGTPAIGSAGTYGGGLTVQVTDANTNTAALEPFTLVVSA